MNMPKNTKAFDPYGATIFCEDIRQEASGLATIVGAFLTNMSVPDFPTLLPKFGILTTVILPQGETHSFDVQLQIFLPGDGLKPSLNIENTIKSERPVEDEFKRDPDIPPHVKLMQHLVMSPLEIKQAGHIKVRVLVNNEIIKAGVLKITKSEK